MMRSSWADWNCQHLCWAAWLLAAGEPQHEVHVHNKIMDTAVEVIHRRFLSHGTLYNDLAILDPRNFPEIRTNDLPQSALQELSKCLLKFNKKATVDNLQCELKNLARQWDRLKASPLEEYMSRTVGDKSDEEDEEEVEILHKSCTSCKNCPLCCYQILSQFNLLTDAYHLIGLAY